MSYIQPPWNYPGHAGLPMDHALAYDPTMVPPPMMHPVDGYLYPHPPMEMIDYYHQPIMDYDEYTENLSRPRLTKEQVEILESQFQAHPKPSSNTKRQLAAQTNLSLPRVANWFQNRRAKAKQQKRQEEFEKMQKAKAEAEEAARRKDEPSEEPTESRPSSVSREESERSPTPTPQTEAPSVEGSAKADNQKHHKSKSESAREATFASLQRALNAAVAARDRFTRRGSRSKQEPTEDEPISPGSMAPPKAAASAQEAQAPASRSQSFQDWPESRDSAWPASHEQSESRSFPIGQSIPEVPGNVGAFSGQYQPEEWQQANEHGTSHGVGCDSNLGYANMQYPMGMQTPDISVTRRESSSALTASLDGIGICTPGAPGMPQASSWKEPSKELDLAARRKRPRPAAIGTSNPRSLASSTSMSALSPTSRMPSSGAGNSMRHSKSTQSLNSRYAGVRKSSANQRSPLNFTFAESGSMKASKAEMLRPSVSSSTLAPPTPLTPQEFQHLLPASPTDSNYCLSAQSTTQFFPSSQPMQVNLASPPSTPLDLYSPFGYQQVAPPMSAPAQVSNFQEYVPCDPVPMTARSWADSTALSSPDYQSGLQVPHSSTVSPLGFNATLEHPGNFMEPVSGSPS
ncbi:hypothetical protein N7468_001799 [Penicillium chermesinum]|uniref:Homeobox domain-containing protein n=1 Tax=Penicillium chermesinum TaxID=63820 RepID=A0A9W9TWW5_9EURO|nr:uncharacterized protein N7468_001799 [Penicillium chermesinum]KAJ5246816.1 hypothetical protein N7468_001799 [Penicillium chermesinum]